MIRTVKVRVAVAVDTEGHWNSMGWCLELSKPTDGELIEDALYDIEGRATAVYFLTADLTIPDVCKVEEVSAEVEEAS